MPFFRLSYLFLILTIQILKGLFELIHKALLLSFFRLF